MNNYLNKDNIYRNGEWNTNHSEAMVREKARSKVPSINQVKFRDDLYNFCMEKGILKEGFPLARTKHGMISNIRAFKTIIAKNGLVDEFRERKDNEKDS